MEKNKKRFFASVFVQDIFAIPLAKFLISMKVNPNLITLFGLFVAVSSCYFFLNSSPLVGSLLFFLSLILDSTDGRVARGLNRFSEFGARLDSVSDKIRTLLVTLSIILANTNVITHTLIIYTYTQILPLYRYFFQNNDFDTRDPIQIFWEATIFKDWLNRNKIVGIYNGWERAIFVCVIAPLTSIPIIVILLSVLLEQLLFIIGKFYIIRNNK